MQTNQMEPVFISGCSPLPVNLPVRCSPYDFDQNGELDGHEVRSALLHFFGNCTYLVPQSPGVYCGLQGRNSFRPGEQPLYRDCTFTTGGGWL